MAVDKRGALDSYVFVRTGAEPGLLCGWCGRRFTDGVAVRLNVSLVQDGRYSRREEMLIEHRCRQCLEAEGGLIVDRLGPGVAGSLAHSQKECM